MFGKLYKYKSIKSDDVEQFIVYVSFGGLLMMLNVIMIMSLQQRI